MTEPEKNQQDISTPFQDKNQYLQDTDAVNFAPSSSYTNFLIRLGLAKSSLRDPIKALKQKNWQTRVLALQVLADMERDVVVSLIRASLQDPHEAVRMAAVRALGKRWKSGKVPLELFVSALKDEHVEVRTTTVKVLETLGSEVLADPIIALLIGKLHHRSLAEGKETGELVNLQKSVPREESLVCIAIIHLLGTLGENAPLDELADMLSDPDWQIREAAVSALEKLGDRVPTELLLDALYDEHRFVRDAAISALGNLLPVKVLLHNLFALEPSLKEKTAELLGAMGERTQQQWVINALLQSALTDQDATVRKASLLAIGQVGMPVSRAAVSMLLQDYDPGVREVALLVLSALQPDLLDEKGNINPGFFNDTDQQEELMNERTTEQSLPSVMPVSSRKPRSSAGAADYTDKRIGNYHLLRPLDSGGQATVYLGEHIQLYTQVAVKVLHRHLRDQDVQNFLEEARTIASLKHPNIVRVLDCSVVDGIPYIVMDYLWRGTLRNLLASGLPTYIRVIVVYVKQLARALDYAHSLGVIHLDIKPENILLGENNMVLLSDFGIARRIDSTYRAQETIAGTLSYAAPEQLAGRPVKASDQYALAIVVYELLVGSRLFEDWNTRASKEFPSYTLRRMLNTNPQISRKVLKVILQALADQPENRYPSVQAFADALEKASLSMTERKIFNFFRRRRGK